MLVDALEAHGLCATAAMELGSTTAIKAAAMSGADSMTVTTVMTQADAMTHAGG